MFCLDTSVIVGSFRNKAESKEMFLEVASFGEPIFISVVAYGELCYGAFLVRDRESEEKKIGDFLAEFNINIEPLTIEAVQVFAKARFSLNKIGKKVDNFDLLIGATAVVNDSLLVTHNSRHFVNFPGLRLFNGSG